MKNWQIMGVLTVLIIGTVLMSGCTNTGSTSAAQSTYSSAHNPGEKFVVTLPGANGGSTQAEIIMLGSYESKGGETHGGYYGSSWYYNISIKNVGDRGIQLPMSEYAEDSSGISAYIDQLYNGHQIVLHPGEEGTSFGGPAISNKIFLLQSEKTPRGGGIYHLNLGGTIIDFIIPQTTELVKKVSVSPSTEQLPKQTVTSTPKLTSTPTVALTQDSIIGVWTISGKLTNSKYYTDEYRFKSDGTYVVIYYVNSVEMLRSSGTWRAQGGNSYAIHDTRDNSNDVIIYDPALKKIRYPD